MTVFFVTPVIRTVERMELPSTMAATTRVFCSIVSRFIYRSMCLRIPGGNAPLPRVGIPARLPNEALSIVQKILTWELRQFGAL